MSAGSEESRNPSRLISSGGSNPPTFQVPTAILLHCKNTTLVKGKQGKTTKTIQRKPTIEV
jgi:hypothetical protein